MPETRLQFLARCAIVLQRLLCHDDAIGDGYLLHGLDMLVHQGAASFELWTGRKAPLEVMFQAARTALAERERSTPGSWSEDTGPGTSGAADSTGGA